MTPKAMLIDITKCVGCRQCEATCKEIHGLPAGEDTNLSANALTVIQEREGRYVRRLCMHCQEPACASACLVGALKKSDFGPVTYDSKKCIGCRYCMMACPYQVPKYEWSKRVPFVKKCDMCAERVAAGKPTACAEVCPVGATIFGNRDDILREARMRIETDPAYVRRIYGIEEAGGASVFFLSDVPFEKLGFMEPPKQPLPTYTAAALNDIPTVVIIGGAMLGSLYWITKRREAVAAAEAAERAEKERK